jgi:hypothetical protein
MSDDSKNSGFVWWLKETVEGIAILVGVLLSVGIASAGLLWGTLFAAAKGREDSYNSDKVSELVAKKEQHEINEFAKKVDPYFIKHEGLSFVQWLEIEQNREWQEAERLSNQAKLNKLKTETLRMERELDKYKQKTR